MDGDSLILMCVFLNWGYGLGLLAVAPSIGDTDTHANFMWFPEFGIRTRKPLRGPLRLLYAAFIWGYGLARFGVDV